MRSIPTVVLPVPAGPSRKIFEVGGSSMICRWLMLMDGIDIMFSMKIDQRILVIPVR